MRVMGIDPSLTGCGLALVVDGELKTTEVATTGASEVRGARLFHIATRVLLFYAAGRPDVVAIEGYSFASKFNREEMGEVGGVIKYALWNAHGVEPLIWPNFAWKKAVLGAGKGNTKKEDLKLPVYKKYGVEISDMNAMEAFCVAMAETLALAGKADRPVPKPKGRKKS